MKDSPYSTNRPFFAFYPNELTKEAKKLVYIGDLAENLEQQVSAHFDANFHLITGQHTMFQEYTQDEDYPKFALTYVFGQEHDRPELGFLALSRDQQLTDDFEFFAQ